MSTSPYLQLRDEHVRRMVELRFKRSETDLLKRMCSSGELMRRQINATIAARQLTFGEEVP